VERNAELDALVAEAPSVFGTKTCTEFKRHV
jgi:hypothetical protein